MLLRGQPFKNHDEAELLIWSNVFVLKRKNLVAKKLKSKNRPGDNTVPDLHFLLDFMCNFGKAFSLPSTVWDGWYHNIQDEEKYSCIGVVGIVDFPYNSFACTFYDDIREELLQLLLMGFHYGPNQQKLFFAAGQGGINHKKNKDCFFCHNCT